MGTPPFPLIHNSLPHLTAQVGALSVGPEYTPRFQAMFHQFCLLLAPMLPPQVDIAAAYARSVAAHAGRKGRGE